MSFCVNGQAYGGAVAVHPALGLSAGGSSVAGVEGNRLEDGEHSAQEGQGSWARCVNAQIETTWSSTKNKTLP